MTPCLDQAFAAIARLTLEDQETIGALILEEIASDERWQKAFSLRPDVLKNMAEKAIDEHRAGDTHAIDPDGL